MGLARPAAVDAVAAFEAAMRGTTPRRVDLARPIRVMPDDGAIHLADDIYGHDARLERALAARSAD